MKEKDFMSFFKQLNKLGTIVVMSLALISTANAKVKVGQVFPDFTLNKLSEPSASLKLSSLKGKVVIIDFWASWCEPCKVELPILNKINKKFQGKGLEIIGVNEDKEPTEANSFLKESGVSVVGAGISPCAGGVARSGYFAAVKRATRFRMSAPLSMALFMSAPF